MLTNQPVGGFVSHPINSQLRHYTNNLFRLPIYIRNEVNSYKD